jgi:hypothetical protein
MSQITPILDDNVCVRDHFQKKQNFDGARLMVGTSG